MPGSTSGAVVRRRLGSRAPGSSVGTAPCLSAEHLQVLALVVLLGVFSGEEVDRNKHVNTMSVGDQWSAELGLEARECQRGWSGQAL